VRRNWRLDANRRSALDSGDDLHPAADRVRPPFLRTSSKSNPRPSSVTVSSTCRSDLASDTAS
jgi:hypothetical protein